MVQHIPLGGLLPWSNESLDRTEGRSVPSNNIASYISEPATQVHREWARNTTSRYSPSPDVLKSNAALPSWSTRLQPPRPRTVNAHAPISSQSSMPPLSPMRGHVRDPQDVRFYCPDNRHITNVQSAYRLVKKGHVPRPERCDDLL